MFKKNKKKYPKIGVAFSGGSALGIAHVGVIKALMKNKIPIDFVSGTSAGAVAAVCVAFGVPLKKMIEVSERLSWSNVSRFGYSKMGLNSNRPVGEIIKELIGDVRIEDAYIPLAIVAANIDTGEEVVLRKGSVAEAVMASTCLPALFIPIKIKGKKLVDGGLVENLPLSPLKKMGAQLKIGVNLGHWRTLKKSHNILEVITNSYSILTRTQQAFIPGQAEILIEPHLEKFTSSDFKKADALMDEGYRAASLMIGEIKKRLNPEKEEVASFFEKIANFFKAAPK
ncbi:MAG TPA: patatin-like phospholipase family protein [Candidatus Moranbacteria bacterium]|nr:patatin-like phospholipase family protein [Candidatus Moranbacteria bacterium]